MTSTFQHIEKILNDEITSSTSIGGGCIAQTQTISTRRGTKFFLKSGFKNGMFQCEANGLNELRKAQCIRIPEVIHVGEDFLLLQHIPSGRKNHEFFANFGKQLACLHKINNTQFGFFENNFIGATPQINLPGHSNWIDFYFTNRLKYQYNLAEKNGYVTNELKALFKHIESTIHSILEGSNEPPALLHGDLWGGNYMVDADGEPVLIDPAVYYGHREADLAMTKLFGGFNADFYKAYEQEYPLKEGHSYREPIYLLYHVMNHLNLFGQSYLQQCIQLMSAYR